METWLEELSEFACRHELGRAILGRLAVVIDGEAAVFPVNHVYDDLSGAIYFPSNLGTKLHAVATQPRVAFEVDGVDPGGRSAWSVVVVGPGEEVDDEEAVARVEARRSVLWAVDDRTRWLRIIPERVTGRRISTIPATIVPER